MDHGQFSLIKEGMACSVALLGDLARGEVKQAVDGHLAKGFGIIAIGQFCDKICG